MNTKNEEPRLYTLQELREGCGGGWHEVWYMATDEDPEYKRVEPCGFCRGYFVLEEGSNGYFHENMYNHRYGFRVWTAEPSEELMEAAPWDG